MSNDFSTKISELLAVHTLAVGKGSLEKAHAALSEIIQHIVAFVAPASPFVMNEQGVVLVNSPAADVPSQPAHSPPLVPTPIVPSVEPVGAPEGPAEDVVADEPESTPAVIETKEPDGEAKASEPPVADVKESAPEPAPKAQKAPAKPKA